MHHHLVDLLVPSSLVRLGYISKKQKAFPIERLETRNAKSYQFLGLLVQHFVLTQSMCHQIFQQANQNLFHHTALLMQQRCCCLFLPKASYSIPHNHNSSATSLIGIPTISVTLTVAARSGCVTTATIF